MDTVKKVKKVKTREEILANLRISEMEEGREGLVAEFLEKESKIKKEKDK